MEIVAAVQEVGDVGNNRQSLCAFVDGTFRENIQRPQNCNNWFDALLRD